MFQMLDRIDRNTRKRVEAIAQKAATFGDNGVVEWAARAAHDAVMLGRLRDKDVEALERLEGTYSHDYYSRNSERGNPIFA